MLTETVSDPCQLPVLQEEAEAGVGKKFVPRTSGELGNSFHWEMAEVETRGAGSGASSGGRCKGDSGDACKDSERCWGQQILGQGESPRASLRQADWRNIRICSLNVHEEQMREISGKKQKHFCCFEALQVFRGREVLLVRAA